MPLETTIILLTAIICVTIMNDNMWEVTTKTKEK